MKKKMAGRPRGGATLLCPVCASVTGVLLTKRNGSGLIERQRCCKVCGHRFHSIEMPRVPPNPAHGLGKAGRSS